MRDPTDCLYWNNPDLAFEAPMEERFELVDTFVKESHWWRYLLKCRECGHLYFYEFYEEIDWEHGNDPQCSTYVPVGSGEEVEILKKTGHFELETFGPRLIKDFPKDAKEPKIFWVK